MNTQTQNQPKAKVIGNICYNSGTKERPNWIKCGVMLERADGSIAQKMDTIPVGFSGWFSVFEPDQAQKQQPVQQAQPQQNFQQQQPVQQAQPQQNFQQQQPVQQPHDPLAGMSAEQIQAALMQRLQMQA